MSDGRRTFGVVEAQRRFRYWSPTLATTGQRAVYGAMLAFAGMDSVITPTYDQLAGTVGMHPSSVRRIVGELEQRGALMRVGDRPVTTGAGVAKGGRIPKWAIPPAPLKAHLESPDSDSPSAPCDGPKRAL